MSAAALGLTMVLGFIAGRAFDVALQIDPGFALGFSDTFVVGARALWAFVVIWVVGGVIVGALAALVRLLVPAVSKRMDRIVALSKLWDPLTTAAVIVLLGVALWASLNLFLFGDLFAPLLWLAENPSTTADLSTLGPAGQGAFRNHYIASAAASLLLGFVALTWFPQLEKQSIRPATVRLLKWVAVAIALAFIAWAVVPRRIVWERHPVVEFDNRAGFVIGTAGNELLIYAANEPGRPRLTVRDDATGLRRTGDTRFLFGPVRAQ
jgi:hypothetical protein